MPAEQTVLSGVVSGRGCLRASLHPGFAGDGLVRRSSFPVLSAWPVGQNGMEVFLWVWPTFRQEDCLGHESAL